MSNAQKIRELNREIRDEERAQRNKRKTNVEMLTNLMEFSAAGPLIQAFVLTAVEKYADQCIAAGAAKFESGLMSGEAWIRCAVDAKKHVAEHLGR